MKLRKIIRNLMDIMFPYASRLDSPTAQDIFCVWIYEYCFRLLAFCFFFGGYRYRCLAERNHLKLRLTFLNLWIFKQIWLVLTDAFISPSDKKVFDSRSLSSALGHRWLIDRKFTEMRVPRPLSSNCHRCECCRIGICRGHNWSVGSPFSFTREGLSCGTAIPSAGI